ncbi:unnamed protein product [Bursaphelenchus okinawaensis]|uniref:Uncharacterized protein n=1 Tax=Bursaphelenchus okinawaensis TaxID=465554 RepID=A0A811KRI2_9BILA|nr:unnamed protein product [Bursaphelenchus okinawaensis]CAG9110232.1 unnamed protein product [Bursaphelenchus okinawaensis]
MEDPELSDDDLGSEFSVLDEREESFNHERENVDYKDNTSHTVSEYQMSDKGSLLAGTSDEVLRAEPYPQFLTLSQFVSDGMTEKAVKTLLDEYKVNKDVLEQVLSAVMEIKLAKKLENDEEMKCLKEQNEALKSLIKEKDSKVSELETIVVEHVKGSHTTLTSLTSHMDKINDLAESINSLKMSTNSSQFASPESLATLQMPSAPASERSTFTMASEASGLTLTSEATDIIADSKADVNETLIDLSDGKTVENSVLSSQNDDSAPPTEHTVSQQVYNKASAPEADSEGHEMDIQSINTEMNQSLTSELDVQSVHTDSTQYTEDPHPYDQAMAELQGTGVPTESATFQNDVKAERDELAVLYEEQCILNVELKRMLDLKVEEIADLKKQIRINDDDLHRLEDEVNTQKAIVKLLEAERADTAVDVDPMLVDYENQIKNLESIVQSYQERNESPCKRRRHHRCAHRYQPPITTQPVSSSSHPPPASSIFTHIDQKIAQSIDKVNEHLERVRNQHLNRMTNAQMFVCQSCMHAFRSQGQLVSHQANCPSNLD